MSKSPAAAPIEANTRLSIGHAVSLACLLEASVPKPGNIHRSADFTNSTFYDFVVSAVAIGNVFETASQKSVGQLVLESIHATQGLVGTNTNLGMVLLIAPLAKTSFKNTSNDLLDILGNLTEQDCYDVYSAISLAKPGGLGKVSAMDVNSTSTSPSSNLIAAMELAKQRDTIALQFCNGFTEVREFIAKTLTSAIEASLSLPDAIVFTHVKTMATIPDTLISRKCGLETANQSAEIASQVIRSFESDRDAYHSGLADLDFWLRSDGHRRNPGTTADLVAAAIFYLIRTGSLSESVIQRGLNAARQANQVANQVANDSAVR